MSYISPNEGPKDGIFRTHTHKKNFETKRLLLVSEINNQTLGGVMQQSSAVYRLCDPELWEFHQLWSLEHSMISEGREKDQQQWENRSKSSCSFFWVSDKESPSELGLQVQGWNPGVSRGGAIRPKKSKAKEMGGWGRGGGRWAPRAGPACCRRGGCSVHVPAAGSGSAILTGDYILKRDDAAVTVFCL